MIIIRRISRVLALIAVYIIGAYSYLTAKGFIFKDNTFILSHPVYAKEEIQSRAIEIDEARMRSLGSNEAPLTIYAYSSMSCAHCRDFHRFILPKLERDFIDPGKLRFIFVHLPSDIVSMRAAKLSYCLPPEKFYDFIGKLYEEKDWLFSAGEKNLEKYAQSFGMTPEQIQACNDNKKLTSDILLTRDNAIKDFGITGTPSFIVEGKDGKEVLGARSYDDLKDYLNKRLEGDENVGNT